MTGRWSALKKESSHFSADIQSALLAGVIAALLAVVLSSLAFNADLITPQMGKFFTIAAVACAVVLGVVFSFVAMITPKN